MTFFYLKNCAPNAVIFTTALFILCYFIFNRKFSDKSIALSTDISVNVIGSYINKIHIEKTSVSSKVQNISTRKTSKLEYHIPKYMLELYKNERNTIPDVDVVKSVIPESIVPVRSDESEYNFIPLKMKNIDCFNLLFDIPQTDFYDYFALGEFRIKTVVEKEDTIFTSGVRKALTVMYFDMISNKYKFVKNKHIYGHKNAWEIFNITEAIESILRMDKLYKERLQIQVCIKNVAAEPLFKKASVELRDDIKLSLLPLSENAYSEHDHPLVLLFYKIKTSLKPPRGEKKALRIAEGEPALFNHMFNLKLSKKRVEGFSGTLERNSISTSAYSRSQSPEKSDIIWKNIQNQNEPGVRDKRQAGNTQDYDGINNVREDENKGFKASSERRKKRFSNSCKRKPLYVNFADINYDAWIVQPSGYEAFQCWGKCLYPMAAHLSPSKHAVVQALSHSVDPSRAHRTCCVPTKLGSISILYVDSRGILTYRFAYQDMVVLECGCR